MNLLQYDVMVLPGPPPLGPIVKCGLLNQMLEADKVLDRAKLRAGVVTQEALRRLDHATTEGDDIRERAYQEGMQEAGVAVEAAKSKAITDAINWMVQEQKLEQRIVSRLEREIRTLAAQAFTDFVGNLDSCELLLQHLGRHVSESINEGKLELRVNPVHWARAVDTFVAEASILVVPDKDLTIRQAILNSPYVQIQLDLDRHLQLLVNRLRQASREVEIV